MDTYLAPAGATNLQNSFNNGMSPINISGSQVGSSVNFNPDSTMVTAQGTILVDNKTQPASVKVTPVHVHEIILTVIIDRDLEFAGMGNIVIFAGGQPFIWSISKVALPKVQTDPVAHFAGDRYYFPILIRYPYIRSLVSFNSSNVLSGKFPVYDTLTSIPRYPEERPNADQVFVEKNNRYYGRDNPCFVVRTPKGWAANPFIKSFDESLDFIDGGTTLTGF